VAQHNRWSAWKAARDFCAGSGEVMQATPAVFGSPARLGNLYDYLARMRATGASKPASCCARCWWRWALCGQAGCSSTGSRSGTAGVTAAPEGMVPFHKLTQWLTYSLLEPLEDAGLTVTGLDALTGLPEYRNGGLLYDFELMVPRDATFAIARTRWMSRRSSNGAR
jgi:hypothetical protein